MPLIKIAKIPKQTLVISVMIVTGQGTCVKTSSKTLVIEEAKWVKVKAHKSQRPKRPELISGFRSMKHAWEYCYSPLDGMLVHSRVTPQQYVTGNYLYTWVKRDKVE